MAASRKLRSTFNRCVKSVRKTVRARKGSNKESAAIGICTKSVLQSRGKTMKRYRRGRLTTQAKFRGGEDEPLPHLTPEQNTEALALLEASELLRDIDYRQNKDWNDDHMRKQTLLYDQSKAARVRDYLVPIIEAQKASNPGLTSRAKDAASNAFGSVTGFFKKSGGGESERAIVMLNALADTGTYTDRGVFLHRMTEKIKNVIRDAVDPTVSEAARTMVRNKIAKGLLAP